MHDFQKRPIILASKSPRRSQLLDEAGFVFTVKIFETEEDWPDGLPLAEVAQFLAVKKARAAAHILQNDEIILAADTTVLLADSILNKPGNHAEAVAMLRRLSGKMHRVVTGVCLLSRDREVSFSEESRVFFDKMTDAEIEFYIKKCQPFDKAGAYGVQEWIGHCKIRRIEGTYANVMGLPVNRIYSALAAFD